MALELGEMEIGEEMVEDLKRSKERKKENGFCEVFIVQIGEREDWFYDAFVCLEWLRLEKRTTQKECRNL